jgi:hypothetical protein
MPCTYTQSKRRHCSYCNRSDVIAATAIEATLLQLLHVYAIEATLFQLLHVHAREVMLVQILHVCAIEATLLQVASYCAYRVSIPHRGDIKAANAATDGILYCGY